MSNLQEQIDKLIKRINYLENNNLNDMILHKWNLKYRFLF